MILLAPLTEPPRVWATKLLYRVTSSHSSHLVSVSRHLWVRHRISRVVSVVMICSVLYGGCGSPSSSATAALVPLHSKMSFLQTGVDENREGVHAISELTLSRVVQELLAPAATHNIIFSPWSLVRSEMLLDHAPGAPENSAIAAVIGQLSKWEGDPATILKGQSPASTVLRTRTALIADRALALDASFLDLLARYFDMGIYTVKAHDSRLVSAVNAWATGTAHGHFTTPLTGAGDSRSVYLADITAVYSGWEIPFVLTSTRDSSFSLPSGEVIAVPTMQGPVSAQAAYGSQWKAIQLGLSDGLALRIVVPSGSAADWEKILPEARRALDLSPRTPLTVNLPRWTTQNDISQMWPPEAHRQLTQCADHGYVSGTTSHAAVSVSEEGLTLSPSSLSPRPSERSEALPSPPPRFSVDHAFGYEIYDPGINLILLAGRIVDPRR